MSYPSTYQNDVGAALNLEVHVPVITNSKCNCFFWRSVKRDAVVFDEKNNRLVAVERRHMTESEKAVTRAAIAQFIRLKMDGDESDFRAICKFIDFDPDKSDSVRIRQVQRLREIIDVADKVLLRSENQ